MFLLLNFFLLSLLQAPASAQNCSVTACRNSYDIPIRFPFRIKDKQTQNCSYPGFDLKCDAPGHTVIILPRSGEFFVRDIDYSMQQIRLYDPGDCLPRRLLQFSLSGTPFSSPFYQNYSILSCPASSLPASSSQASKINCLSNGTNTVLGSSDERIVKSMVGECTVMATVTIPVPWQYQGDPKGLDKDLVLSWYTPNCFYCETGSGMCGPSSGNSSGPVACYASPDTSQISTGFLIFKIICLSVAVPAIFVASCLAIFFWWCSRNGSGSVAAVENGDVLPGAEVAVGLDESTIESFDKVVLGESLRVIGPNQGMCPICLSEYQAKEVLRSIPECKHCFHSDCIDEWLRLSTTCPVCRNSPSPSHQQPHSLTLDLPPVQGNI
ncbi:hypothetical protein MLD38_036338 [Melastoma candidum]|uniref:Uncharacterized protein n=1 Tax=Melastoma candidum TaxID=119954 RepID=A0ACB9LJC7_9MYRT|nr:hypothetical protein MLD38_036338 [Melastoma candidum]